MAKPDRPTVRLGAAIAGIFLAALICVAIAAQLSRGAPPFAATTAARLPGQASDAPLLADPAEASPDAQARNAAVPFFAGKLAPAPAFRFKGSAEDRIRAADCLALAALAEAGASADGQRAVMQVVLNRVRHPAFAHTVCGVVYQGAERRTGCQFSFTCDGSLVRKYGEPAWAEARRRAQAALGGQVFAPVGNATHYHTDWVYPWWSPSLVKLARVDTHLFFRWPGYWGSPASLHFAYRGGEPEVGRGEEAALVVATPAAALPPDTPTISGGAVAMRDPTGRANFVVLTPTTSAEAALGIARALCKPAATCRVLGWGDRGLVPAKLPIPPEARAALQFSFTRDPAGAEIALYDCTRFKGLPRERCIPKAR